MPYIVRKRFQGSGGRTYEPGQTVPSLLGWRNGRKLVEQRYLEPMEPPAPAEGSVEDRAGRSRRG